MRAPTFEEEPTHDERELCAEINGLLKRQAVAKLVENGSQNAVGSRLVGKLAFVAQFLKPYLKSLNEWQHAERSWQHSFDFVVRKRANKHQNSILSFDRQEGCDDHRAIVTRSVWPKLFV